MTAISIDQVSRTFGTVRAVDDVSLEIKDGEFFTLLGPSGCGKTTLLRMIAGFADLSAGEIRFGEKRIDTLPPHRRNAGMVFQNYAIFPNLTVGGNVAYGLKARSVAAAEIKERVARALRLVHLDGYGERWPHQLSGGQLQRVAIARCLVIEPEVLLLDEPLSNLDAKLRVEMRAEIRQLQQELKITAIYVTHDQEEALAMSDRVAVMRAGRLEQVARPQDIYRAPATPFVAEFMGTTNLLKGTVSGRDGEALRIRVGQREFFAMGEASEGASISFSLRPETIRLLATGEAPPPGWRVIEAELGPVEFLGAITRIELDIGDGATLRVASLDLLPDQLRTRPRHRGLRSAPRHGVSRMIIISRRDTFPLAIAMLAFAFLGLFLLYPLLNVFGASFLDRTGKIFTFANYVRMLSSSFYLGSLGNSLLLGVLSTLLTIAVGVPLAFCLARLPISGKSALLALASLPLVLPSFVAAYALVLLLGRAGIITKLLRDIGIPFTSIYGMTGMTIVFAMTLFPFVVFPSLAAFKAVDVSMEEAGQNLGASRWRTFWTVTLPIVMPAVLAGGLLVFIEVIESFGVPFVLAEDKPILSR